ncbi:hypothetical protein ACE7GA_18805 [Roseomonas sp. CCTCC AB2023176]|uniref:hypothetical protein n=1 Tax=Roseomonas sp. CCTCC AB2023176 TaxID=3342640 RepID=UPI0035DED434
MIKASLVIMTVLTVLISIGLRWREQRVEALRPVVRREGWIAAQKRKANRWVTAAALAAVATLLVLGGLQWLRVWQNG